MLRKVDECRPAACALCVASPQWLLRRTLSERTIGRSSSVIRHIFAPCSSAFNLSTTIDCMIVFFTGRLLTLLIFWIYKNILIRSLNGASCGGWNIARLNANPWENRVSLILIHLIFLKNLFLLSMSSYECLGVRISADLSWQIHVEYGINNANRTVIYLDQNCFLASSSRSLTLYKTVVGSKLHNGSPVWDPGDSKRNNGLESVPNRTARFILSNYHRIPSVPSARATLSSPNLALRPKMARLCLFRRIYPTNALLSDRVLNPPFYICMNHHAWIMYYIK